MTRDAAQVGFGERQVVGPEDVPGVFAHRAQDADRHSDLLALTDEEANEAALCDGTRGERTSQRRHVRFGGAVMHVVPYHEGDQHVGVEQGGHGASSSTVRTSSLVTTRPTDTTGSPVAAPRGGSTRERPRRAASLAERDQNGGTTVPNGTQSVGSSTLPTVVTTLTRPSESIAASGIVRLRLFASVLTPAAPTVAPS